MPKGRKDKDDASDKMTRIAIVNSDKCKPKRCRQECKKGCPVRILLIHANSIKHYPQAFFNTTWEVRRGKILPGLEFFPWVLSFLLEFLVFPWDFWIFLQCFSHILINFDIFPLEFNFSKIFVNKNAIKSPTPSNFLSFDRKIKFFSWIFLIGGKILPEVEFFPWVFGLSFFLEF